jgi:FKBP12-rapamycin complex-associated protein
MDRLLRLSNVVDLVSRCEDVKDDSIQVACWLELGEWKLEQAASPNAVIIEQLQVEVLTAYKRAISSSSCGYKACHSWALLYFRIAQQISERDDATQRRRSSHESSRTLRNHVVAAVSGFVYAVSLGTKRWSASVQQDMLKICSPVFSSMESFRRSPLR